MRTYSDYTVGLISALPLELAASMAMLDGEPHPPLPPRSPSDQNIYTLGNISGHNVVLACLPAGQTGIHNASTVAAQMSSTFESIRFGLMVGVGGGVPSGGHDIRLGDVVVSKPSGQFGGVVQYDFGKTVESGFFERTGSLNAPPRVLLNAVSTMIARHELERSTFTDILANAKLPPNFSRPGEEDRLFEAKYNHEGGDTCQHCDLAKVVNRSGRDNGPHVHYGTIGCANRVMKDGATRDRLRKDYNILCFEMEAAGLMNDFPCLVIRGICDYSDSHKNHRWQRYAAAVAAAYAKELLSIIPTAQVAETPMAQQTTYAPNE
jgi:nucleoside phosphorylase